MELIEEELGRAPQGARVNQVLAHLSVSKATFYRRRGKRGCGEGGSERGQYQSRPQRARDRADPPWLVERIRDLVSDPYTRVYGYRKVHAVLDREGVEVSEKVVRGIMRHNGWQRPRKRRGGEWV